MNSTVIYILFVALFAILLGLVAWVVWLSRMFYTTNAAMDEDLSDLEDSVRTNVRHLNETLDLIKGLIRDYDVADRSLADAEAALASARAREMLSARRADDEGDGDDVVYTTDR